MLAFYCIISIFANGIVHKTLKFNLLLQKNTHPAKKRPKPCTLYFETKPITNQNQLKPLWKKLAKKHPGTGIFRQSCDSSPRCCCPEPYASRGGGENLLAQIRSIYVTVDAADASIREILESIEAQSDLRFIYADEVKPILTKVVTVREKNVSANRILDQILPDVGLQYSVGGTQVRIYQAASGSRDVAQTVSGTVISGTDNSPLAGVMIYVEGTTAGTITNGDGSYTFTIPAKSKYVTFSYVGFDTKKLHVEDTELFKLVSLAEQSNALDEVVVIGYGTQKKESMVASITSVKPSDLNITSSSLTTAFAGNIAGMISRQTSGEPGYDSASFYIRGISTFGSSNSPLIILDGVEVLSNMLNNMPPESIESFSVLKDAQATSVYGSRGANGVILINTKNGRNSEKMNVSVRLENTFSMPTMVQQVADGVTYMQLYNEAVFNTAKETGTLHAYQPFYSADKINGTKAGLNKYLYPNNDWYDLMFKDFSVNQNLNLNIRGGGRKVSYFLNAAVSNENGIIADIEQNPYDVKMNHQKYIFQSNVSANITKTTVVGIKVNAQLEYNTRPIEDIGNLFYYSMRANPVRFPATLPAEEGDTFVRYGNNASWDTGATDLNPLAKLSRGYGKRYYSYMTTAFTLDQNLDFFTKGLSANLTASFYNYTYSATYRTATPYYFKVEDGSSLNPDGTANLITNSIGDTGTTYLTSTDGNGGHRRYALQASLNYARKFGKHDVGAMFVYRMNEKKNNIAGTSEENLLPYREQGMAGRVTYGFDNRYLFEASFGYNGSENFAPGKRWGFFPSAAAGWVISNESFWDGIRKTVSNLKIRVSYGLAGNDALGERFPYRSIVAMGEESGFYYNWNSQGKGPKITTYGNPNATWEEAKKLDVGLELGLFNALNIEAAYFTEDRTGIFMRRTSLPSSTGLLGVTPYGNIGRVKSHGVDLSAVYNKQFNKDWSLSLRGTFTFSRNEVVEKDEGDLMYDYMSVVGHPVNAITGVLVADGLFTSQEEIDNSPKQRFGNYTVGDIKYRDLNGDGIVDGNDVTTAGSPTVPEIQYGIGATVKWRRLDFSFMFQGASNVSLRMYNMHPFCDASHFGYGITQYIADNHWSEDNNRADAAYPRLTSQLSSNNTQSSTFYIHDAKYLRLKTVELGYTIKKLRVYLSGNNLFVISPFDYWDPEKGGGHGLSYPLQRMAKIGVQYQF